MRNVLQWLVRRVFRRKTKKDTSSSEYPSPETWEFANELQRERALRSFAELRKQSVPVFTGPLFVDDENAVQIQPPVEVARRTMILWAVALRAEGVPKAETLEIIEQQNLWNSVSPSERAFLENENPSPEECQSLVWRYESIWVLMWALGHIEHLDWPSGMCDVVKLAGLLSPNEDETEFISSARLRPAAEILDAQDLIMRIHWAIRDAYLNQGGMLPVGLDWSQDDDWVPVSLSAEVGVVEQRHYTLNWLVNFLKPENWDEVDAPT
jgi:Domain of unknown function (DUF4272)